MSDDKLYDIYSELFEIKAALMPSYGWHERTCGECGWHCIGYNKTGSVTRKGCRHCDFEVAKDDPACPAFILRLAPEDGKEADD